MIFLAGGGFIRSLSVYLLIAILTAESATTTTSNEAEDFQCTEFVGVSVTADWFRAGFKKFVGSTGKFQLRAQEHAFVELWGNVKSPLWTMNVESPCTKKAKPDRVIFFAVNWDFKSSEEWETSLLAAVKAIKERHYSVEKIEILTMLRGPKNRSCGDEKTVVSSLVDNAIDAVATIHRGLVVAGPKLEAPSCDVFLKGGPHFSETGKGQVAELYANYYAHHR